MKHQSRKDAGARQESDVAFHLRRGLDPDQFAVFHNVQIEFNGERAQIDHLIVHKYGFIVVESKSIHGEVRINKEGEWSRSYKGAWSGMASPLKQGELQVAILKSLLAENAEKLLGKLLGIQTRFGGRKYDVVSAISSSAIFHREGVPTQIAQQVVKTEFLCERVKEIVKPYKSFLSKDTAAAFTTADLHSINEFLQTFEVGLSTTEDRDPALQDNSGPGQTAVNKAVASANVDRGEANAVRCKKCSATAGLTGAYGKYGYYVTCGGCGTNTSLKGPCPKCQSAKTKVAKSGSAYTRTCQDCNFELSLGKF
ncbi:NERD domain-containing protein [gamma proteobacterium BDW918]|nr:NERD domain-containing protein [gamma proteobacterium BDW918]